MIIIPVVLDKNDVLNQPITLPSGVAVINYLIGSIVCGLVWFFGIMVPYSSYHSVGWCVASGVTAWVLGMFTFLMFSTIIYFLKEK